jgi:hypothetical protein
MDFRNNMLRVFSGPRWNSGASYLQTFDASDLDNLAPLDQAQFGHNQAMFAAIFLEDRAFAVTYWRTDPFHAFSIAPNGDVEERNEFIVSGWNDFFRPVLNSTRLIGIGVNDENGRKMAVSLYDITNLSNTTPMVTRAEVSGSGSGWSWSEANWDHRAFTVLDNAVNVQAPTGETETGLVLLPFSVWSYDSGWRMISAVQIFTYSSTTLTRRGLMSHGTPVLRTFPADQDHAANLSDSELSVFDRSNPDAPTEIGRLPVAPSYKKILSYENFRVRVRSPESPYWWWGWYNWDQPLYIEVISKDQPAESAVPVATFEVPYNAKVFQKDEQLIVVASQWSSTAPYYRETTIAVHDLSQPSGPQLLGSLTTTGVPELMDWLWHGKQLPTAMVAGDALVFMRPTHNWDYQYRQYQCERRVNGYVACYGQEGCTYAGGDQRCYNTPDSPDYYCEGAFAVCTDHANADTTCVLTPFEDITVGWKSNYCGNRWVYRQWTQFEFVVVDLTDPANPTLGPTITTPSGDEGISMLASGSDIYVTVRRPTAVADDPRGHVAYTAKRINLSDPSQAFIDAEISVPGEVLAVNGSTLYTVDKVWGEHFVESAAARLELSGATASLQAYQRFANRTVGAVAFDGAGMAVAHHDSIWRPISWRYGWDPGRTLSVLGARASGGQNLPSQANPPAGTGFEVLSESRIPGWLSVRELANNRALLEVPEGMMMVNLDTPRQPRAQAAFPVYEWPREFVFEGNELLFAAQFYGIHQIDLDDGNLQPGSAP